MKKISFLFAMMCLILSVNAQNIFPATGSVGIGTVTPDASSLLDMVSTAKGLLIPRMTKAKRDAIAAPATGLLIYQTNNTPGFYYYSGTAWAAISTKGANTSLSNLSAPTAINAEILPGTDNTINFGSVSNSWKDVYVKGNFYFGGNRFISNAGTANTFVGESSGISNAGINNSGFGFSTLYSNTTGIDNTANGYNALYFNTTGSYNTANGFRALYVNTTGQFNTATGVNSLFTNSTGNNNTANGNISLYSNTTGSNNTACGYEALFHNTTGNSNTAIGFDALYSNTTGINNSVNGVTSLYNATTAVNNTASGYAAMLSTTTGSQNIASGSFALYFNTTGNANVATGYHALFSNTTGGSNTANGYQALTANTTGTFNTGLGYNANVAAADLTNATVIGYNASVDASNKVLIGNTFVTSIGGQVAWTNFSDGRIKRNIKENVPGLAFINLLKPVTYNFNLAKQYELMGINDVMDQQGQNDIEKINFTGFVAQDVDAAAKKTNYDFSGIDKSGKIMGLRYSEFVVPLVKAVQELSKINDVQKSAINAMQQENNALEERLLKLEGKMNLQASTGNNKQQIINPASASLEQNIPNPFSSYTTIHYTLPQKFATAQIIIVDNSGNTIKTFNLRGNGKGSVVFTAPFSAGASYNYALYVDGKMAGSKQMMLVK